MHIGPNLRISFNYSYFWIGLGQDFQATLWIGLDWVSKNGPLSNSGLAFSL